MALKGGHHNTHTNQANRVALNQYNPTKPKDAQKINYQKFAEKKKKVIQS